MVKEPLFVCPSLGVLSSVSLSRCPCWSVLVQVALIVCPCPGVISRLSLSKCPCWCVLVYVALIVCPCEGVLSNCALSRCSFSCGLVLVFFLKRPCSGVLVHELLSCHDEELTWSQSQWCVRSAGGGGVWWRRDLKGRESIFTAITIPLLRPLGKAAPNHRCAKHSLRGATRMQLTQKLMAKNPYEEGTEQLLQSLHTSAPACHA